MSSTTPISTPLMPPGPKGLPILGSLLQLRGNAPSHISITKLAREYGDVSLLRLGGVPTVVINHPQVMADAFDRIELSSRSPHESFAFLSKAEGLIHAPYGEHWKTVSEFTEFQLWSAEDVYRLSETHFAPAVDKFGERLRAMADAGEPVDTYNLLIEAVFELAFRTLFGWQENESDDFRQWKDALRERIVWFCVHFGVTATDLFPWMRFLPSRGRAQMRKQRDARDEIIGYFVESVDQRRKANSPATTGLVDLMLEKEENGDISRPAVLALCMDVLGAVPAGVAATVSWFYLIMANRPQIQAKMHEELDRVIGRENPHPSASDRNRLPYSFSCVAESMRYRTIAPLALPHIALQDTQIEGYRIPKDTSIFGNIYSIHNDERFWDSPEVFNPERFMPKTEGGPHATITSPAYMPFSTGVRRCTGDHFAVGSFWLYAVRIMHHLRFETLDGKPFSEEEHFALSIIPKPHRLKVLRR